MACGLKSTTPRKPPFTSRSCHVCGMWIEIWTTPASTTGSASCHVCGMWIEIEDCITSANTPPRHATYVACGLKFWVSLCNLPGIRHATYVACGLKSALSAGSTRSPGHATYVACGLKSSLVSADGRSAASCHVCGMWIEIHSKE